MQIFTGFIVTLNKLILMFDYETLRKKLQENLLIILTIHVHHLLSFINCNI